MNDQNDFKTHFIMVMVFLIILIVTVGTSTFCAYKVGRANGKLEGTMSAYTLHPPTTITGPGAQVITNNNVTAKPHFQVKIWPPCLGVCP